MTQSKERKGIRVPRRTRDIFATIRDTKDPKAQASMLATLRKAVGASRPGDGDQSNSGYAIGQREHLMDKTTAREIRDFNPTHAISLEAKVTSTVGMGHRDEKIAEALDPLCRFSWQDTLDALAEDFWETGECFLEVVRGDDDPNLVTGLYHLESAQVYVVVEEQDNPNDYHYVVNGETSHGSATKVMARFGDLTDLKARYAQDDGGSRGVRSSENDRPTQALGGQIVDSEIIHIRQSTNRSPFYGYPDYMSAVPSIELVQCMTQAEFDFYFNRGVPEFMLFLIGSNLSDECWEEIEAMVQGSQGLGNQHKTGAVHIPGSPDDIEVQIEKLAMDDQGKRGFAENYDPLASAIATAHGVPLILANIAIPGRMGGSNEGPNALMLFQKRKLGKAQRTFSMTLACTLGHKDTKIAKPEGGRPNRLTRDQFLGKGAKAMDEETGMPQHVSHGNGFNTILDGMNLGAMDTISRMREPLTGSQRDPADGINESASDREEGDTRGQGQRGAGPPSTSV